MGYESGKKGKRPTPFWVYQTYYQNTIHPTLDCLRSRWKVLDKDEQKLWINVAESLPVFPENEFNMDVGDRVELLEKTCVAVVDKIFMSPLALERRRQILEKMPPKKRDRYVSDPALDGRTYSLKYLLQEFRGGRASEIIPSEKSRCVS
jgi:hypothetical protein